MEYVDVFDENNNFTNHTVSRKEAHEKNLYHRHVSCWIMNEKGQILLEQRAACKKKNPNMWAKIGGHVDAGETVNEAIIRETKEEIGIQISNEQVEILDVFKSKNNTENYFTYNFLFYVNYDINDYSLQEDEVQAVKYFEIEELEQYKLNCDTNFTFNKWDNDDFIKEMNLLKQCRDKFKKHK